MDVVKIRNRSKWKYGEWIQSERQRLNLYFHPAYICSSEKRVWGVWNAHRRSGACPSLTAVSHGPHRAKGRLTTEVYVFSLLWFGLGVIQTRVQCIWRQGHLFEIRKERTPCPTAGIWCGLQLCTSVLVLTWLWTSGVFAADLELCRLHPALLRFPQAQHPEGIVRAATCPLWNCFQSTFFNKAVASFFSFSSQSSYAWWTRLRNPGQTCCWFREFRRVRIGKKPMLQPLGFGERFSGWGPPWSPPSSRCSLLVLEQADACLPRCSAFSTCNFSLGSAGLWKEKWWPQSLLSIPLSLCAAGSWIRGLLCVFRGTWGMWGFLKAEVELRAHCWGVFVWVWQIQVLLCKHEPCFWKSLSYSCLSFRQADFESDLCGFGLGLYPQLKWALI